MLLVEEREIMEGAYLYGVCLQVDVSDCAIVWCQDQSLLSGH